MIIVSVDRRLARLRVVESPALEAWQVEPTDSLAFDADKINGTQV